MNQIDLGFLNRKQLARLIKEIANSDVDIIELHVLKVDDVMSVLLKFRNAKDKDQFDSKPCTLGKYSRAEGGK